MLQKSAEMSPWRCVPNLWLLCRVKMCFKMLHSCFLCTAVVLCEVKGSVWLLHLECVIWSDLILLTDLDKADHVNYGYKKPCTPPSFEVL